MDKKKDIVDAEYIDELFGSRKLLIEAINSFKEPVLEITPADYGEFMGSADFIEVAFAKFDRRNRPIHQSHGVQRWNERFFEPPEKVFWEFEKINKIKIDRIDTSRYEGKRLRGELLVLLKEKRGLKYTEIGDYHIFASVSFASLRSIYRNMKKKKKETEGLNLTL